MPDSSNKKHIQRTNRFGRDIRRMSADIQTSAFEVANQLAADIFDPTISVKPLTGFRGIFRAVVIRDYRMIFSFDDENLYLLRIGHRREIYRNLEL